MKKNIIIFAVFISLSATYSFTTYNKRMDDIFKTLGIPATHAKDHIWKSFAGKYFSFPPNTSIKNYPQNKRVATIHEIGAYVAVWSHRILTGNTNYFATKKGRRLRQALKKD